MTKIFFTLFLYLISAVPYCGKCSDEEKFICADTFSFTVVDKTNGNDLIFGLGAKYHPDSVYLTTNLPGYLGKVSGVGEEKIRSGLTAPVDTFFLRLSGTDSDTLTMSYDFISNDCCSQKRYGRIVSINYNGSRAEKKGDSFEFRK